MRRARRARGDERYFEIYEAYGWPGVLGVWIQEELARLRVREPEKEPMSLDETEFGQLPLVIIFLDRDGGVHSESSWC